MTDVQSTIHRQAPGALVRGYRTRHGLSLDDLANEIQKAGGDRPSYAKLSRIETGVQPVPIDILESLSQVTGIGAARLRPDLAKLFSKRTPPRGRPRRARDAA